ncbi:hypothetical protein, partial [Gallibacterium salpingitidis]
PKFYYLIVFISINGCHIGKHFIQWPSLSDVFSQHVIHQQVPTKIILIFISAWLWSSYGFN